MNPFFITETYDLLPVIEKFPLEANFLQQVFFPNTQQFYSDILAVEYLKHNRRLAPYVTKNSRGVNMSRERSKVNFYQCPLIGAKRVIGLEDISRRSFGEVPVFSSKTPEERAAELQVRDMRESLLMLNARKEQMCSELMQTSQITIKAFADDGKLAEEDLIEFTDGYGVIEPQVEWDNSDATILDDLKAVCDRIAADSNLLPTVMIVGANVESYLMNNTQVKEFFSYANRQNITALTFAPQYTSPQSRRIGVISSLGLEVYSYLATYIDDSGQVKPFIEPNNVLIGVAGRGTLNYGRVDYLDLAGNWQSIAAENVPVYNYSTTSQTTSLSILSRCCPVPNVVTDWACLRVAS